MARVFICHSTHDKDFVLKVSGLLKTSFIEVFYYEEAQRADEGFTTTIDRAQKRCDYMIIFVGDTFSEKEWQKDEIAFALNLNPRPKCCVVDLRSERGILPDGCGGLVARPILANITDAYTGALHTALDTTKAFNLEFKGIDGLPSDTSLFSYEKDIIKFYSEQLRYSGDNKDIEHKVRKKLLGGCPPQWPTVPRWMNPPSRVPLECSAGQFRDEATVVAATLSSYHGPASNRRCMLENRLVFPEAGPREHIYYPHTPGGNSKLRVAILVAGGIAPGINAVIDGIVQRHWEYSRRDSDIFPPLTYGIMNGLNGFNLNQEVGSLPNQALVNLVPSSSDIKEIPEGDKRPRKHVTSEHAREGGSIIGTARVDELIFGNERQDLMRKVVRALKAESIDILYVIGGDGSMKLAHALWNIANLDPSTGADRRKLSIVAVPKTMDNDILWVWQAFGFMSAVEKSREVLTHLDTEIKSNPRLCILQLFGSDSGFVVSHTVAASGSDQCDVALIPEVRFSLMGLANYLSQKIQNRNLEFPTGLIAMAETAIPTDAIWFITNGRATETDISVLFRSLNLPRKIMEDYIGPDVADRLDFTVDDDELYLKAADKFLEQRKYIENKMVLSGAEINELSDVSHDISLTQEERMAIMRYHIFSYLGLRIQGQTSDELRSAGLKIVSRGLRRILRTKREVWSKLRDIVTNEPRHILRAIAPTSSDIITASRLGTLAVDGAMAGFTDFMVSQWLTEYVYVPLKLVVLGRKRIPKGGMFWKSVLAKTGQLEVLDVIGSVPGQVEFE